MADDVVPLYCGTDRLGVNEVADDGRDVGIGRVHPVEDRDLEAGGGEMAGNLAAEKAGATSDQSIHERFSP